MMRVEGHKHLFREDSGAIVNTDTHQYNEYVRMRSERKKQREEIEGLKNDISEIKSLLMEIINGPKHDSTRNND
jgi:SPX domain protein involved in polyphosphate accumulation